MVPTRGKLGQGEIGDNLNKALMNILGVVVDPEHMNSNDDGLLVLHNM